MGHDKPSYGGNTQKPDSITNCLHFCSFDRNYHDVSSFEMVCQGSNFRDLGAVARGGRRGLFPPAINGVARLPLRVTGHMGSSWAFLANDAWCCWSASSSRAVAVMGGCPHGCGSRGDGVLDTADNGEAGGIPQASSGAGHPFRKPGIPPPGLARQLGQGQPGWADTVGGRVFRAFLRARQDGPAARRPLAGRGRRTFSEKAKPRLWIRQVSVYKDYVAEVSRDRADCSRKGLVVHA
jgi:hypothetical protein